MNSLRLLNDQTVLDQSTNVLISGPIMTFTLPNCQMMGDKWAIETSTTILSFFLTNRLISYLSRVGVGDFIDFIWIHPDLVGATFQHRG